MLNASKITSHMLHIVASATLIFSLASCAPSTSDGTNNNTIALPTDSVLALHCSTVGINTDGCVLFDPNNPYANVAVNDTTKWILSNAAPSEKAKFYVWATALARSPSGENQYYTAQALHKLYTITLDPIIKAQALLAYRSVLVNFFGSVTYIEAVWVGPGVYFADPLANKVGTALYNPTPSGLGLLYANNTLALDAMSTWGYVYNVTTGNVTVIQ
ncbi:MAG: hypothetical protein R8M14_03710 [Ghiorsea sp.]